MPTLAQRLIAEEIRLGPSPDAKSHAAFQVCEKLRGPLSTFAGVAGFRSLLLRALVLARAHSPVLSGVQIAPDGTFLLSPEFQARIDTPAAAHAAELLVDQLLGLLEIFIGEALTLRLVHEVWPRAASQDPKSGGK